MDPIGPRSRSGSRCWDRWSSAWRARPSTCRATGAGRRWRYWLSPAVAWSADAWSKRCGPTILRRRPPGAVQPRLAPAGSPRGRAAAAALGRRLPAGPRPRRRRRGAPVAGRRRRGARPRRRRARRRPHRRRGAGPLARAGAGRVRRRPRRSPAEATGLRELRTCRSGTTCSRPGWPADDGTVTADAPAAAAADEPLRERTATLLMRALAREGGVPATPWPPGRRTAATSPRRPGSTPDGASRPSSSGSAAGELAPRRAPRTRCLPVSWPAPTDRWSGASTTVRRC